MRYTVDTGLMLDALVLGPYELTISIKSASAAVCKHYLVSQLDFVVVDHRDTVQLYEQLYESGLQYGPAFRLLRNVHVPDPE